MKIQLLYELKKRISELEVLYGNLDDTEIGMKIYNECEKDTTYLSYLDDIVIEHGKIYITSNDNSPFEFLNVQIKELLDQIDGLEDENEWVKSDVIELENEVKKLKEEIDDLKLEISELDVEIRKQYDEMV